MTGDIFFLWYDEIFIPHVKEQKHKTKKLGKMLLIIDNAPGHPSCELLDRVNVLDLQTGGCKLRAKEVAWSLQIAVTNAEVLKSRQICWLSMAARYICKNHAILYFTFCELLLMVSIIVSDITIIIKIQKVPLNSYAAVL
ncbi:hypothetical protein T10_12815 [Trichinella papuae]|uniref:DDE-1 domain-containing protein n=1 Tax=Trichinella papuae TaxID=268474 RepID=A0A0V1M1I4_9BILA|nr:hypothetical protein T10_12815 [Trichinella papuae]